ncbi:MAG TPA: hypothetical protein DEQ47_15465 [Solibacterales bacterium]|nr:hypothetical protein [Bryobacterales bacterium]
MTLALLLFLALQVSPELKQHVEAGLAAKRAGDLPGAVREFRRAAELAPDLAAAHVNLGAVYLEQKDYGAAIPEFRRGLQLQPDLPGAEGMLGIALLAQGYAGEAVQHLEKAGAEDALAVALLQSGRAREALDKLEAALQNRPDDPDLLFYLGQAHAQLAKQAFEMLAQHHPESARARQTRGEAHAAAGDREAAARDFAAALAARPDLRGVHLAMGELDLGSGDFEGAEREFRQEARLSPGDALAAYKLGLVLLNRGRTAEALPELQRADALRPGMPETLLELAKAKATAGDPAGAEKLFRQVIEQEKTTKLAQSAHFQLAQIYRKLGRAAEAAREMDLFQELRKR